MAQTPEERREYRRKYYLEKEKGTDAFKARCRKHRQAFYTRNKDRVLSETRALRQANKNLVVLAKSRPCADCGQSYPPCVMDLDHVRGTKITHLGSGRLYNSTRLTIEEIAKCDVVCANCHRLRTYHRAQEKENA